MLPEIMTIIVYRDAPVNQPPVASFTYECTNPACTFDASASYDPDGEIASYDWDFGDSNSGSGVTASHTYAGPGIYSVLLTITDDENAAGSESQYVAVGGTSGTVYVIYIAMAGKQTGPNRSATTTVSIPGTEGYPATYFPFESKIWRTL